MKKPWRNCASYRALGGPGLCVLASLVGIACSGTEGGGDQPAAGGSATGGAGQVVTGGIGGVSGATQGTTGGGPGANGGTGNSPAIGAGGTTGGAPATGGVGTGGDGLGGGGTGGVSVGTGGVSIGTGGVSVGTGGSSVGTGGDPGSGTGGVGTGGDAVGSGGSGTGGDSGSGTGGDSGSGTGGVGTGGLDAAGGGGAGGDGVGGTGGSDDTVTRTDSTYTFQHFPIETDGNDVWSGASSPATQPTSTTYDTVVLENGYLRVTLLPEYGGRILSIVHKPTNRELLYQNPLGTPYLMYEDIFYYDYLMILGGIFPSFPEPEHGKYWNQPYDFQVVSESDEAITVRMSIRDDRDLAAGVPANYDVGRTDVLVELDVTLRAGSSSLELDTTLTNTRSSAIPEFEYWTVTTLAPGSTPGQTSIPLNTRIMAEMDTVHLLESSWSWFGDAETRVSDEVFNWENLSYFQNWVDQGTAFAYPGYSANWSGLINYDNDMGILRVSGNVETPGLKLWTFGRDSLNIDVNDSNEWLRPTIEMWHGVTPEFWDRGTMSANEVRQWSDTYFPTLGLREVTAASEYGALYLSSSETGSDKVLSAAATLTLPDQTVTAILRLNGTVVAEQDAVVATTDATTVNATVASSEAPPGAVFEAEFLQGQNSLLSGQTTLQ
jgi:hypothetical protein